MTCILNGNPDILFLHENHMINAAAAVITGINYIYTIENDVCHNYSFFFSDLINIYSKIYIMKDNNENLKKQALTEILGSDTGEEYEREPAAKGIYTKPVILQHLIVGFDHFRQGMDEIANAYSIMESVDPELHRKVSRFGDNMSKMINGLGALIQQQGGSIESITKPKALQKYFGEKGMSALGMNESKQEIFDARMDLHIDRIKSIMKNTKR